jgi:hypothetical protein
MNGQTASPASPHRAQTLAGFTPATAAVNSAELHGRIGVDVVATVSYQAPTGFELMWQLASDPSGPPTMTHPLDDADLRALLGEIRTALGNPAPGLDTKALEAFSDIVEDALSAPPDPFAQARFGPAVEDIFGGTVTVVGQVGLGVDVAATIHDSAGTITWEHHVLPRPPGPLRPLNDKERDGLTAALSAYLEGNPNASWQRILRDLES